MLLFSISPNCYTFYIILCQFIMLNDFLGRQYVREGKIKAHLRSKAGAAITAGLRFVTCGMQVATQASPFVETVQWPHRWSPYRGAWHRLGTQRCSPQRTLLPSPQLLFLIAKNIHGPSSSPFSFGNSIPLQAGILDNQAYFNGI